MQEGFCCCKPKQTSQIKHKGMHLRNTRADLLLNNIRAVKGQIPGAFLSEDFHSFLISVIVSLSVGAPHLEVSPNALCMCI